MRFDLASVTSAEMSSAWAAAIPRMLMRRGGMVHPANANRRYSDSGENNNIHKVSVSVVSLQVVIQFVTQYKLIKLPPHTYSKNCGKVTPSNVQYKLVNLPPHTYSTNCGKVTPSHVQYKLVKLPPYTYSTNW